MAQAKNSKQIALPKTALSAFSSLIKPADIHNLLVKEVFP